MVKRGGSPQHECTVAAMAGVSNPLLEEMVGSYSLQALLFYQDCVEKPQMEI